MSMEAQFYEARRRQSNIERRSSLRTEQEINKQLSNQQNKYQYLSIPVRVIRQDEKKDPCTCNLIRRMSLIRTDQPLFQRDRDIYPRPVPIRRHNQRAKLRHRFTSTDYLQQW